MVLRRDLSLVSLFQFLPSLTLVAGHVDDQFDRRKIVSNWLAGQLLVVLGLITATMTGSISGDIIALASLGLGAEKAFHSIFCVPRPLLARC